MDFYAGIGRMRSIDNVLQGIKSGREIGILGPGLYTILKVGVAPAANLDDQRVEVASLRVCDKLLNLSLVFEAIVKGVDPQSAHLGRIELTSRLGLP